MRADRLVATTLYLQRRGRVTAAELAEHLGTSVATARRDLEALSAAGVPVYPQPGRGGGWQLVGGARTDLTGLTEPEVRALFLALGGSGGTAAGVALAKLVRALPPTFRDMAEVAASAHRVDHRGWEAAPPGREPPALPLLRDAVLGRRRCVISYRRRGSAETVRRLVEPWRLVDKDGVSYLLAGTENGARTFRVDRVDAVEIDETTVIERPRERDLDEQWRRTVVVVSAARTSVRARVRADPSTLALLARHLGSAFEPTDVVDEAVVAAHTERGLAEQLAGWGERVVVLDRPGVVSELRAIAVELLRTYAEP